ncbi:uncharacterized protein LOC135923118 [Gordionus sp. m RMFG-2023]|uniref:uncharacterized protein LOC135923118 n=1 Tax=Gordionus sp. m RMFG-2023 TaxID=3053472 RepID=UPI0031FDDE52
MTRELDVWPKVNIIELVSQVRWASPLTPVIRRDGIGRVSTDLKETINSALETRYPLQRTSDLIEKLVRSRKFTKIDFKQTFLQIPTHEESRDLFSISIHKGCFRFTKLSFVLRRKLAWRQNKRTKGVV